MQLLLIRQTLDTFKFVIGNKGVGPAFIEKVEIELDSTFKFDNTYDLFKHIFSTTKALDTVPYVTSTLVKGFVLPANENINVLEIRSQNNITLFKY